MISEFQRTVLENEIAELREKFNGDFMHDIEIGDEIHRREMILNGVIPINGEGDECLFCGS